MYVQRQITQPLKKMPFAAKQMDLEIVILNKSDSERQISNDIAYLWNLKKKGTNELNYKTEVEPQIKNTNIGLPGMAGGRDELGDWD